MNPTFKITMENGGVIEGELYPDKAPQSVYNFIDLCNHNFYDGLIFHRVIPGFMTAPAWAAPATASRVSSSSTV